MVRVGSLQVRARLYGSGRPLMLVNGIGCGLETWTPLERNLRGFQVLTFDPPGIGRSTRPRWPLRVSGHARIAVALADHFGWDMFDVLGLSWGGTVAQEIAHRHADRVRRLILCATTFGLGGYSWNPVVLGLMSNPFRHTDQLAHRVAPLLYGGDIRHNPHGYDAFVRQRGRTDVRGYYEQVAALRGWSSLPWLRTLTMPTLVMAARRDQIIPGFNARVFARLIPDARVVEMEGGHLSPLLRAEAAADIIRGFLCEPVRPVRIPAALPA